MTIQRYSCPAIAQEFSRETQIEHWAAIWHAASHAVSQEMNNPEIAWVLDSVNLGQFMVYADGFEAQMGHDIAAGAEALRSMLPPVAANWLHYGLCSSDIADATLLRTVWHVSELLLQLGRELFTALNQLAKDSFSLDPEGNWRLARTHGQAAIPTRFYNQVFVWAHNVEASVTHLRGMQNHIGTVSFGGPVPGSAVLHDKTRLRLARTLGLEYRYVQDQAFNRCGMAAWLQAVASLAGQCEHIATQVRLGAQTERGEFTEPSGVTDYRGSSSMPHKTNPTRSERICGLVTVIRALVYGYQGATAAWWDQHSLEHSSVERVVIPQVCELTGYVLTEMTEIISGLLVNYEEMESQVANGPINTFAERNRLIREGVDGGQAWQRVKGQSAPTPVCTRCGGSGNVVHPDSAQAEMCPDCAGFGARSV